MASMRRRGLSSIGKSVFTRIMVIFLVAVIPLVTLSYSVYYYGSNLTRQEIAESLQVKSRYWIQTMENEIERINYLLYNLLEDKDLGNLAHSPRENAYERYLAGQRLVQRLGTIRDSSTFLKDVRVHIPSIDYSISVEDGMKTIDRQQYDAIWQLPKHTSAGIVHFEQEHHLILYPIYYENQEQVRPQFIVDALISPEAIERSLELSAQENSAAILFTDQQREVYFYYGETDLQAFDAYVQEWDIRRAGDKSEVVHNAYLGRKVNLNYVYSEYFNMALLQIVTENIYLQSLHNYQYFLALISILTIVVMVVFSAAIYRSVQKPVAILLRAANQVGKGNLRYRITHRSNNELQHVIQGFNSMMASLETLVDKVYKQEILTKRAELKQLQTQIDPHFLFNSFFMLKAMLKTSRTEEAEWFLQHLGDYYQYVTRNDRDYATLQEELEHVIAYSSIQMMRFKRSYAVRLGELGPEIAQLRVPRMILQPLIENTIEHGMKRAKQRTEVEVCFAHEQGRVAICIQDTGGEVSDWQVSALNELLDDPAHISAVVNIHRRIRILYGARSGIRFERNGSAGLSVRMYLYTDERSDEAFTS